MSQPTNNMEDLREAVLSLRKGLEDDLIAIVLFGSRARGDAHEDSDWDLLVIAKDLPPSPLQRNSCLKRLLPVEWRSRLALVARTPEEFELKLTSLILDIALDARVLYDRRGYASERLANVKGLIKQQGIRRERIGKEWVWKWDAFPGFDWSLDWKRFR